MTAKKPPAKKASKKPAKKPAKVPRGTKVPKLAQAEAEAKEKDEAAERERQIVEMLAGIASGESVKTLCKQPGFVAERKWYLWLAADADLQQRYARACESRAVKLAEELLDIADDGTNDWMLANSPNNPGWVTNGEALQRSRLRADTRKWLLAKLQPKKYGDKLEVSGNPEAPMRHQHEVTMTPVDAFRAMKGGE